MSRLMLLCVIVGNLFLYGCSKALAASNGGSIAPDESETALAIFSNPDHEEMNHTAPAEFDVLFRTSVGDFVVRVKRIWAPIGSDRFYNLVLNGYYDGTRFFRIAPGRGPERFVVQWGIHGHPSVNAAWQRSHAAKIEDDPVVQSNTRGRVTFATSGENSRTTQLFISYADYSFLDKMGFSAFGEVIAEGMEVVDNINGEYEERPSQTRIQSEGNAYLNENFPNLDYIISTTIMKNNSEN